MRKRGKASDEGREASVETRKDNVDSAARIFQDYGDEIYAMIHFQANGRANADDIFQALFLSLAQKSIPAGHTNIKGYLYRAIANDVIDVGRRSKTYQNRVTRYAEQQGYYSPVQDAPETAVVETEQVQRICDLIEEHLPRCEAQAVTLTQIEDLSTEEAARIMGVEKRTISRYKCVGLKKIRQILAEEKQCAEEITNDSP